MKNLLILSFIILLFTSCDPVSDLEANVENLTSQTLIVDFISSDDNLNKTLQIAPNGIELFQEGFDVGSTYLEPSLVEYDSVVVKNQTNNILKIYKGSSIGRNIYNISDWIASEPVKRVFKYEFEIADKDIE